MRVLGLDVGSKTIGVAVSDAMGWTAQGVTTIVRTVLDRDLAEVARLLREYEADRIVIGLPLQMDGGEGVQAGKVKQFAEALGAFLAASPGGGCEIAFWDERLSTVAAERGLLEADLSRAKRKKVINKMAAVFILQGFLDSIAGGRPADEAEETE